MLIRFYAEECGLQEAESASLDQTRSVWAKTKEWADYLSNKHQKFDVILMIYVCGFGLRLLLEVILYRLLSFGGTLAVRCQSRVERCPLLGGSKSTISIGRAIRGMEFVRCTEVVHLLESPLLEFSLYIGEHLAGADPGGEWGD